MSGKDEGFPSEYGSDEFDVELQLPKKWIIAFDILLLELIRWLIIINTIFFCCCLHLTEHLLLYAHVSFKLRVVFWLLCSVKGK